MKKMLSKFVILLASMMIFAQSGKFIGILEEDVENWIENFNDIQKEFKKKGIDSAFDFEQIPNISQNDRAKLEQVLNANGITGSNCIEKYVIITHCAIILASDSLMDEESKENMKAMGIDPLEELENEINPQDYEVIYENYDDIIEVINEN